MVVNVRVWDVITARVVGVLVFKEMVICCELVIACDE